ncbi:MAG: TIM barrel protein [Pirellulales bacterium]
MYKTLDTNLLEITGRSTEVIELAMTYGFVGINVDMMDMFKRSQRASFESASRFLVSSKLHVASFAAPVSLDDDDTSFASSLTVLQQVAEIAGKLQANCAVVNIPTGTNRLPYHEYFDVIRKRIDQVAEVLGQHGVRLALRFCAIPDAEEKQFKFVRDVEGFVALVKSCSSKNVGIVLDTWNWHLGRGKQSQLDEIGADRVAIVYISDCKDGVDAAAATCEDRILPNAIGIIDNVAWLKKLGDRQIPITAYGAAPSGISTRDALIAHVQDTIDEQLTAAGLPTNTRRPETFVAAAASTPYRES